MRDIDAVSKIFSKGAEMFGNIALCVKTICGDKISEAQLSVKIGKAVLSLPDEIFYLKLEKFLNGVCLKDNERAQMRAWIAENGNEEENGLRLISYINNAESLKKVEYFSNATRCALNYNLELELYFRICNAIDMSVEEDLRFLADNIPKNYNKPFAQNYYTQKLYAAGLMNFISGLSAHAQHKFNNLAELVDVCAVNFGNDTKYPNPKQTISEIKSKLNFQH